MFAGPLQGTSLAERLGDAKVRLTVCSQVCPSPCCLRASVALGTLCLVCFRDVYRLQPCWVPCVLVAIEDSIPWFQMGAHNGVDPPRTLSTGLQSASRAEEEAFHGPSHFNELGLAFGYDLGCSSALPTSMLACASVSSVSAHSRFVTYQYS